MKCYKFLLICVSVAVFGSNLESRTLDSRILESSDFYTKDSHQKIQKNLDSRLKIANLTNKDSTNFADSTESKNDTESTISADSAESAAKNIMDNYMLSIGGNLITGSAMGLNLEFGFPFLKNGLFEWRDFINLGGGAMKLNPKDKMDTTFWLISDKMTFSFLGSSSVMSHIGFAWFRPYLFIGAGFGSIAKSIDYYEFYAGLGHEFITQDNHTLFFELGGEYSMTTRNITATNLGAAIKFWLGYRWYF